ncbi:MAG TPA: hypothetical protein VLT33_25350 [Labilithrix sp.]|nr:hypothetical protein [Labilithrix sp.]
MPNRLALHTLLLPMLALAAGAAGGCTGDDPVLCNGPECASQAGPAPTSDEAGFGLNASAPVALVQGSSVAIEVTITRSGFDGAVNANVVGLPPGVAASPLVIAAGATSGKLSLSALANVPQGTTSVTITAADVDGKIRRERPASLLVRGAAGAADTTFGEAGRVSKPIGNDGIAVRALAVQADGRILVGGQSERDVVIARLGSDGTLDATYGTMGTVTADLKSEGTSSYDSAEGLAIAPNGSAVIAGWTTNPTSSYAVARFLPSGGLDTTFDKAGYVVTPFVPQPTWNGDVLASAVVVQPDGKPVFAGKILEQGANHHPVIARFKTGGALDDTFGTNDSGWFSRQAYEGATPLASSDDECNALALAPGDKIVGAGTTEQGGKRMFVVRLDAKGKLDPSFGSGGFAQIAFPKDATAQSVHTLPDGRVLVTGTTDGKMVIARLDAAGLLDTQFGGTGKVLVDVGAPVIDTSARSVLDAAGRIVLSAAIGADYDIVLARVLPSGQVDTSFGSGGRLVAKLGARGNPNNVRIALQPDGRIVAATNLDAAAAPLAVFRFWQ